MTSRSEKPQTEADLAETLHDLSDQTRALVSQEVGSALREMWDKARRAGPAAALLAAAGVAGLFATASAYRLSLRLLETRLPPATAALVATMGYGTAATLAAALAIRQLRQLPPPLPAETARQANQAVANAGARAAAGT